VLTVMMLTLAVGHWAILFYCMTTLKAAKNELSPEPPCVVVGVNRPWLVALYTYTMIFDTIIMVACLWGLWTSKPRSGERASELYNLLWTDGLLYFICASVANAFPVTFMGLALNPVMDIVSTVPSACVATIVSCRAVRRLNSWGTSNPSSQDAAYRMSMPNRSSRGETRRPPRAETNGTAKRRHLQTEGDIHLSSAMFAKTVYVDNEIANGTQYDGQQKVGGLFSLQADDRSVTSSQTTPTAWKKTPSTRSGITRATSNDKDTTSMPYKPTTARVSEGPEQPPFPTNPASLHNAGESIEEDETESEYKAGHLPGPPRESRVIEVGPTESGVGFASGDSESDRERQP